MITLFVSGPNFDLSDGSPFVVKAEMLLKISGIPYQTAILNMREMPKGKIPYIRDQNGLLGDSYFIKRHLEKKYSADFSGGYDAKSLSIGWAVERMLEEHLYFLLVYDRWVNDGNFDKGPRVFFKDVPVLIRPVVTNMVRRKVIKKLKTQGISHHSPEERLELARGDIESVRDILADKPHLLGPQISGADATAFAFLQSAATPYFESGLGAYIRQQPSLMAYLKRINEQHYAGKGFFL